MTIPCADLILGQLELLSDRLTESEGERIAAVSERVATATTVGHDLAIGVRVEYDQVRRPQDRLPVSVILVVSMTAAGIVYPVTDSALHHTSPIMIAALRALVGGALLTAMLPLMGSRLPRSRRLWLWAFAIGLGNTTMTQVGISVGTDRAGAAVASVLLNSSPFFVAVIARFALAESISRLRAAGLVVGFGGVLLVVLADPGNIAHGSRLAIGLGLSLLGALGWAGGGLGMRVLTRREPDLDIAGITAAQFLAGGVPLIPLVLLAGGGMDPPRPRAGPTGCWPPACWSCWRAGQLTGAGRP